MDIIVSCALDLGLGQDTSLGLLTTSLGTLIGLSENPIKKNEFNEYIFFWKIQALTYPFWNIYLM